MKYIVVQKINARIPILSSEKEYLIKFGRYKLVFSPFFEAIWIYMIYGSSCSVGTFSELLREKYKDIRPSEIDQFIEIFKADHPQEHEEFNIKKIPMLSEPDEDFVMNMNLFAFPIAFSYQQEKFLLEKLNTLDANIASFIQNWWHRYCSRYAIHARLKRDMGCEAKELADVFCHIHGFDIYWLQRQYNKKIEIQATEEQKKQSKLSNFTNSLFGWIKLLLLIFTYIMIAVGIIAFGSSIDNFIIGGIVMTIGFGMISVPLALLFGKI